MEASWPNFIGITVLVCGLAVAACRWWYRRQLAGMFVRLGKSERAREHSAQQAAQARKQIEKLQRELSESRRPVVVSSSERQRVAEAALAAVAAEPHKPPALPANGFADTQPL